MHIGEKLVMRNNKSGKRHIDCVNRKFHFAFISIFVLVIILLTFCTKTAFTNEMVDNSKIEYIESRLYIIYESAMKFASEIIAKNKPIFLTKFTDEERLELERAKKMPITFDEDCPETTPEKALKFRRVNPPRTDTVKRA